MLTRKLYVVKVETWTCGSWVEEPELAEIKPTQESAGRYGGEVMDSFRESYISSRFHVEPLEVVIR